MLRIGEKIKELRKAQDVTQENWQIILTSLTKRFQNGKTV